MYVRDWLAQREVLSPEKVALIDAGSGRTLSYRELNRRATRLANYWRTECGVRSGDRIAVLAQNRAEIIEALFAAAKLTAILVPLNYRLTQTELAYILTDCAPRVWLYEAEFAAMVSDLRQTVAVEHGLAFEAGTSDSLYEDVLARASTAPVSVEQFDAEMPWLIIYTSGTTGHPKGALLSHRMLTWNSFNTNLAWDLTSHDITTCHAPLFHTGGLNVLTTPLLHLGGTVVMLRNFDAAQLLAAIEQYRCTVVFGVPTMFQMMQDAPNFAATDFSSLRFFVSGGAPCPLPLIEAYQARGVCFTQGFGLTEVGPNCFKLDLRDAVRKAGSIGFPVFHSEARIVDKAGRIVPRGAVGELLLRGLHVCSGYWRNEAATALALRDGWFHTGDLARQDEEGYFYVAGRAKDMIISGGENIYPAEIEAVLHAHPAIAAAAVFGLLDAKWGEMPVAALVKRAGAELSEAEALAFCQGKLARYKIPKRVFFVEELPLSGSGKVVKRLIRAAIEAQLQGASLKPS